MRKVVLYTLMSLDGEVDDPSQYFAPAQGPNEPPEFDAVMDDNEAAITQSQDAVLLGRGMYDEWAGFWPTVPDQPFAAFINNVTKYVVTSRPLTKSWHNTEVVQGRVEDFIRDLKDRPGGDIGVHGSIELARTLLSAGLVDELRLVVGPVFGFSGRRLFPALDDRRRLELLSAEPSPTGSVLLAYRVL